MRTTTTIFRKENKRKNNYLFLFLILIVGHNQSSCEKDVNNEALEIERENAPTQHTSLLNTL